MKFLLLYYIFDFGIPKDLHIYLLWMTKVYKNDISEIKNEIMYELLKCI